MSHPKKKNKTPIVLAITNQKGGVGKTATAVNLAACFAYLGKSTLLVDADYQGNASNHLGLKLAAKRENKTIADGLMRNKPLAEVAIPTQIENLELVSGWQDFSAFNHEKFSPYRLKRWLRTEELDLYDVVVIDTHPDLSHTFASVMAASDYYIIPLFAEPDSFDGLSIMFKEIRQIQEDFNPTLFLLGTVLTKYIGRNATHRKFEKLIASYGAENNMPILGRIPNTDAMASSSDMRTPLIFYKSAQKIPARDCYLELAKDLISQLRVRRGRVPKTPTITAEQASQMLSDLDVVLKENNDDFATEDVLEFD